MNETTDPRKGLAVVGFNEYKGQIRCVDGWFAADDPRAEEYDIIIEEAGDHIRVRITAVGRKTYAFITPSGGAGFHVNCRRELLPEAIQSLALLMNCVGFIGMDNNDVFSYMPHTADYCCFEYTGDELPDWLRQKLLDMSQNSGRDGLPWVQFEEDCENNLSLADIEGLVEKLKAAAGGTDFMVSAYTEGRKPLVALWLPSPDIKPVP